MKNIDYNLWTLPELESDPRRHLEMIVFNATLNNIQAIKYRENTVFVISEEEYKKLKNI